MNECDNCHKLNGKHAKHCYKGSKNIENVICGPYNAKTNQEISNKINQNELDAMWKRVDEVRKIISETDPHKFPNTISDKKLSTEEKLEFISEIVSELKMDFTDAEHQINYHSDTLADNFRDVMNALNKINCITCMSVEEIDDMENGKF